MSDTLALLALMKKDEGLTEEQVNQVIDAKNLQPKLTAGENITISADNVISATDTGLTQEQVNTLIDSKNLQPKLTAGTNITIEGNVISATDTGLNETEVNTLIDNKNLQPKLTAGTNITIDANNVISATGGGSGGIEIIDHDITQDELLAMPSKLFCVPNSVAITLNVYFQETGSVEAISTGSYLCYWDSESKLLEDLVFNKEYYWLGEDPENPREYFVVMSTVEVADGLIDNEGIILLDSVGIDAEIDVKINSKNLQPKLTAGTNITIDANNVISSVDTGVSEERVNQLIDTKLGVIENGSY